MKPIILVVEDEKPLNNAIKLKLEHEGFEVVTAFDGASGLEIIKSNDNIGLLLLDLVMPKIDGFGVLREMKQAGKSVPTIVITNLTQPEDEQRAKELGAKAFFSKSDTPLSDLVQIVKDTLG